MRKSQIPLWCDCGSLNFGIIIRQWQNFTGENADEKILKLINQETFYFNLLKVFLSI
jgi:hypothetical protein